MNGGLFYHDVFTELGRERVRFVVVGGVAVNLQGVPRFTADLDLSVALDSKNLAAAGVALTRLGLIPRLPVPVAQLADEVLVKSWIEERNLMAFTFHDPKTPLREVDLLLVSPVPFDHIEATATVMEAGGQRIAVASIDVLLKMKAGTGRPQDESDIVALRQILASEAEND